MSWDDTVCLWKFVFAFGSVVTVLFGSTNRVVICVDMFCHVMVMCIGRSISKFSANVLCFAYI